MKSLHNIYTCSNFYKEARIVSFIDRLLECIQQKLKMKISMQKALNAGKKGEVDAFCDQEIVTAVNILNRFNDNFFIVEIMKKHEDGKNKVEEALFGKTKTTETKEEEKKDE